MDERTVAMLAMSPLPDSFPAELRPLVDDPEWWATLEETPESELTPEQLGVIAALGVDLRTE